MLSERLATLGHREATIPPPSPPPLVWLWHQGGTIEAPSNPLPFSLAFHDIICEMKMYENKSQHIYIPDDLKK